MNDEVTHSMSHAESATLSPREHVAKMIDTLAAKGWQGEHILQMIERQTLGFSTEQKRIAFFWSHPVDWLDAAEDNHKGEAA
ncbi:hypothetical protein [Paracoccus sp. J55]|uniref:hypothetical protein n=1 Tax=Paracoccus sp. J55 TaxID=935849 RepID=UPI000491E9E5|nr:hypothetical protein [Paracoccus sp. J55]